MRHIFLYNLDIHMLCHLFLHFLLLHLFYIFLDLLLFLLFQNCLYLYNLFLLFLLFLFLFSVCLYDPETARWSVVVYVQHKYQTVVWVDDATGEGTIG